MFILLSIELQFSNFPDDLPLPFVEQQLPVEGEMIIAVVGPMKPFTIPAKTHP